MDVQDRISSNVTDSVAERVHVSLQELIYFPCFVYISPR